MIPTHTTDVQSGSDGLAPLVIISVPPPEIKECPPPPPDQTGWKSLDSSFSSIAVA